MMKITNIKLSALGLTAMVLVACGGGNNSGNDDDDNSNPVAANVGLSTSVLNESHRFDNPASRVAINVATSASVVGNLDYSVKITNLTNNQPMSPVLVVLHKAGYQSFADGSVASTAIEYMAEGGDNSFLVTEATAATEYLAHQSTSGAVAPKSSDTVVVSIPAADAADVKITVLSMLVNTNDAFTGLNARDISGLSNGDSVVSNGPAWDAGTELNTEASGSMPGPADGGEGFNNARDDIVNIVRLHQGVVSNALANVNIVR